MTIIRAYEVVEVESGKVICVLPSAEYYDVAIKYYQNDSRYIVTALIAQQAATAPSASAQATPVAEVVAGNLCSRLMWHTEDAQSLTPVGTLLYAAPAPSASTKCDGTVGKCPNECSSPCSLSASPAALTDEQVDNVIAAVSQRRDLSFADNWEKCRAEVRAILATSPEAQAHLSPDVSDAIALTDSARRLMLAADDVDMGRSIHNQRKPDDKIEGAVWDELRRASAAVRALLAESPAALTMDADEVEFLAARLRRLFNHFKYPLPDWAKDDKHLIGIAPTCIGAVLANLSKAEEAELAQGVLDDLARKGLAASPANANDKGK